jgi:hypothetical protein
MGGASVRSVVRADEHLNNRSTQTPGPAKVRLPALYGQINCLDLAGGHCLPKIHSPRVMSRKQGCRLSGSATSYRMLL